MTKHSFKLLTLIFLMLSQSYAEITDIKRIHGLFNCFSPELQHLSPFNGFTWHKNAALYYHFGNIEVERNTRNIEGRDIPVVKKVIDGDATIKLLYQLFYDLGPQFNCTNSPTKPASYLDAEHLGKIITCMHKACQMQNIAFISLNAIKRRMKKVEQDLAKNNVLLKKSEAELDLSKKPEKQSSEPKEQADQDQADKVAKLTAKIIDLKETRKNIKQRLDKIRPMADIKGESIVAADDIINEAIKDGPHETSMETARKEIKEFIENIISALEESGDLKPFDKIIDESSLPLYEAKYPFFTPFFIIQTFLYFKAKSHEDFITYCKQMPKEALKPEWQPIIAQQFDVDIFLTKLADLIKTDREFQKLAKGRGGAALSPSLDKSLRERNMDEILATAYDKRLSEETKEKTFPIFYEEICIEKALSSEILPPFFEDWNVDDKELLLPHNDPFFKSCAEATILSWFMFLLTKLDLYDKRTQSFNANGLLPSLKSLLDKKSVSYNVESIQKQTKPLTSFFNTFNDITKLSSKDAQKSCFLLFSNIPGIKYLRRKQKGQIPIKDNSHPAIHAIKDEPIEKIYGKYVDPVDDSYFLYELAGYPENIVKLTNYFFGIKCENLAALLNLFDITSLKDPNMFTDQAAYEASFVTKIQVPELEMSTTISQKTVQLSLLMTSGHSLLKNISPTQGYIKHENIIKFTLERFNRSYIYQNLSTMFKAEEGNPINAVYEKFSLINQKLKDNFTRALKNHLILTQNLFDPDVVTETFILFTDNPQIATQIDNFQQIIIAELNNLIKKISSSNLTLETERKWATSIIEMTNTNVRQIKEKNPTIQFSPKIDTLTSKLRSLIQ